MNQHLKKGEVVMLFNVVQQFGSPALMKKYGSFLVREIQYIGRDDQGDPMAIVVGFELILNEDSRGNGTEEIRPLDFKVINADESIEAWILAIEESLDPDSPAVMPCPPMSSKIAKGILTLDQNRAEGEERLSTPRFNALLKIAKHHA